MLNSVGGQIGERSIDLSYIQIPLSLKLHIIDLEFFKVSFVGSVSPAYLLQGKETISHSSATMRFPAAVIPNLPETYEYDAVYDVVYTPNINTTVAAKENFNSFQLYAGVGFRSDWDISEQWRVTFDLRGNYGLLDPRSKELRKRIENNLQIYDIYGFRRDMFLSFTIGLSRIAEIDIKQKERKIRQRNEAKPNRSTKYPWPKPRNNKPRS